jgi:hypothetical protein
MLSAPLERPRQGVLRKPLSEWIVLGVRIAVLGLLGFAVGSLLYKASIRVPAGQFEANSLSNAQQEVVMAVLAGYLGVCLLLSLILSFRGKIIAAATVGFLGSLGVAGALALFWPSTNARFIVDPTDGLVYPILIVMSVSLFLWGAILAHYEYLRTTMDAGRTFMDFLQTAAILMILIWTDDGPEFEHLRKKPRN